MLSEIYQGCTCPDSFFSYQWISQRVKLFHPYLIDELRKRAKLYELFTTSTGNQITSRKKKTNIKRMYTFICLYM